MTFQPGPEELPTVCPHLGLADDADSHATYATEAHRCYRLPTPTRIASGHQETFCLVADFETCPVYMGEGVGATTPPSAAAASPSRGGLQASAAPPIRPSQPPAGGARPRPASGQAAGQRPARRGAPGQANPRPRSGGVSMPVATIALFAMAIVVIAIAFLIQQAVSDNGGSSLSVADAFATTRARTAAAQGGGQQQTQQPGGQTQQPGQTAQPGQTQQPGQSVTPGTGTPATRTGTPGTGTPASGKTYTVKGGDTCSGIAVDNKITLQQLLDANNMKESDCTAIKPGDVLKLP